MTAACRIAGERRRFRKENWPILKWIRNSKKCFRVHECYNVSHPPSLLSARTDSPSPRPRGRDNADDTHHPLAIRCEHSPRACRYTGACVATCGEISRRVGWASTGARASFDLCSVNGGRHTEAPRHRPTSAAGVVSTACFRCCRFLSRPLT